ncbi:glycosyltransferase family 9 protein [Rubritalea marina]|uniref:glycosyltransferase family 9 protein n=1 Tax=Rubritalea marina TaxID=361055 RepID=UPI00038002F6|nr:glycosyltransferase family 9 protein [Rubritalea marina]
MHPSLITRFGGIGDIVLLTPTLKALHERDGVAPDLITGAKWTIPTLKGCPHIGNIHILQKRGLPHFINPSSIQLKRSLKSQTFHTVYNLHPEQRTARHLGFLNLSPLHDISHDGIEHEASRRLRETGLVAQSCAEDLEPWLFSSQDAIDALVAKLPMLQRPFVLVQPGNKKTMKRGSQHSASNTKCWPNTRWQSVIKALLENYLDLEVVLTGSPSEFEYLNEITKGIESDRLHNLSNDLNIIELKAASCLAAGMITVDTGPAHIAAALGCPMIELFGPVSQISHAPLTLGQPTAFISKFHPDEGINFPQIGLISASDVIGKFDSVFDFSRELPYSRLR